MVVNSLEKKVATAMKSNDTSTYVNSVSLI